MRVDRNSFAAMSFELAPSAASAAISRSRRVSGVSSSANRRRGVAAPSHRAASSSLRARSAFAARWSPIVRAARAADAKASAASRCAPCAAHA